jgi:hypothetical protein
MILNFTNHPYETWNQIQQNEAIQKFESVLDFPFPEIDPNLDEIDLEKVVREVLLEILALKPNAVLIMGEMNFTFQMIYFLMQNNIPCYANTSKRQMEKRGNQVINKFEYVQFRKYRFLDFLFKEDVTQSETFELSEDQKHAFDIFKQFISGEKDEKVMILKGYAGTGKTTLLKFFYNHLLEKRLNPVVATPTNKAKNVVLGKLGKQATVSTLHGLIYTFDNVKATKQNAWTGGDGQLYTNFERRSLNDAVKSVFKLDPLEEVSEEFIKNITFMFDEASMISTFEDEKIYVTKFGSGSLINDFFKVYGTELKYLFIGDPCQLPPPNDEKFSSALSKQFFEETMQLKTFEIELTQVKRQNDDSGILEMATALRNKIVTKKVPNYPSLIYKYNFKDVELANNLDHLVNLYLKHIEKFGIDNCVMICYTNGVVNKINKTIKEKLNKGLNIEVGDVLSNYQNNRLYGLDNGERIIVKEIKERLNKATKTFLKIRAKVIDTGDEIECYILENFLMNSQPQLTPEENQFLMIDFDKRMSQNNIKRNSMQYKIALSNDIYMNALKCKYGYANTIHKSQGSEWDYVFMALSSQDFYVKERNYESSEYMAKLMYTGITRAKYKLFVTDGYWIEGNNIRNPKYL